MSGLKPNILTVGNFLFYSVSQYGIEFKNETPRGEWLDAVKRLCLMHDGAVMTRERTLMLLADSLNFGERTYGEEFAQAVDGMRETLGLSVKTISNAKWAYGKIQSSFRKDGLRLGHYIALAALEPSEQEKYIAFALKDSMTVATLKECVRAAHPETVKKRKEKSVIDDEKTALSKLVEANAYLLSVDINELSTAWKPHIEILYKIYRRRWVKKGKK